MANAKKCDICGRYHDVPQHDEFDFQSDETSMVRILRLNPIGAKRMHDVMHFDTCENCTQDVLDYVLAKQADRSDGA